MSRPSEAVIRRTQNQLRRQGKPCGYYDACAELGRRGGRKRKARFSDLTLPDPVPAARNCLPPGDRD